jgi:deazaflavin-dependent oxidoreductase (nitroreductase family)
MDEPARLPPAGTYGTSIPKLVGYLFKAMSWGSVLMFRMGTKIQGRPLARLQSVGARTGKPRRVILGTFPDEAHSDSLIVVASNAGAAKHPGWAYNLVSNPGLVTIDTGDGPVAVDVELLAAEDRGRMWDKVVDMAPGYGRYNEKTDRQIPLFRLTPRRPNDGFGEDPSGNPRDRQSLES